jgi:two-component system sensor histidine kinase KdpD
MTVHGSPRAQHEALAAVAHDLRLPLTHIKGFVSSLRRADVDWDDNTRSEFLAEIELETDRLAQFVDSLLTPWSVAEPWLASGASHESISAGEHVAFTDPASVLDGALHRIRCLLGGRKVRRKVPAGLSAVRMDASEMERALANLLQNAIKYSPPGTPIGISARIIASNELEFTIDDEGPGIPAEDRERIFEQPLLVMHPLPHGARSIDLQPLDDLITACGQLVPRCSVLARRAKLRTDACHERRPTLWWRTTARTESSLAGRTDVLPHGVAVQPQTLGNRS